MSKELIDFLSQYATFNDDELRIIENESDVREYPKGYVLLREGEMATNTFLVLKGCVRSYYIKDGEEKNTEFFIEHDLITPVSCVVKAPSEYYIECLEDCIVSIGSRERTEQFMAAHPRLVSMCRKILEDVAASQQISWDRFRNLTAEEHYQEIMAKRPELLERIPQYHLASYLGIQPQSLSRIRKRLALKD